MIKAGLWIALGIAALLAIALVIYEIRKASGGASDAINSVLDSVFGPRTVTTPKGVQDFLNQPANQPGGYTPWTPTTVDDSYPPAWLTKGGS